MGGKTKKRAADRGVRHVKKGELVIVRSGNDKGVTGEVKTIDHKSKRVIVEGVNMRWKHKKPRSAQEKGERVQEECSIHASNVMPIDAATGKGTRKRPKVEA